jgi:undecaprenyl-diphosphatase
VAWERHLEHWLVARRTGALDWLFVDLSWIGRLGAVWIVIALVVAAYLRRPIVLVLVLAAAAGGELVSDLGKAIVARHRPFEHQLGPPSTTHSFPSGHAATSFACAVVLAHYAPRLRGPFYALAALIALSRVYNGMHYPTDVIAGSACGVAIALLLLGGGRLRSLRVLRGGRSRSRSPARRPAGPHPESR